MTFLVALLTLFLAWTHADATVITWNFNRIGNLGVTTTELGSDGLTVLALEGYTVGLPSPIVGKQDNPIDHGYGVGTNRNREIDEGDVLQLTFPATVAGPVTVWMESMDGPLVTGEAWAITSFSGTVLGSGFGGGIVNTSVLLPDDHRLRFTVPAGQAPDDYLVASVAANVGGPFGNPNPVPEPATLLLLGTGLVGLAWWQRGRL